MAIWDRWFPGSTARADARPAPAHPAIGGVNAMTAVDMNDPEMIAFMRGGVSSSGATVNAKTVMKNAGVYRCVTLISNAVGQLPLQLLRNGKDGSREKARDHPLFDVLASRPNSWQTAFVFRRLMQHRVLIKGNAYALVIRAMGKVTALIPIDPDLVTVEQLDDWTVQYRYRKKTGGSSVVASADMLHLMGPSHDGLRGMALTDVAADVLGLALSADQAAGRAFKKGTLGGNTLEAEKPLKPEAFENLKASLQEQYAGAENTGKWMVLEEGMKVGSYGSSMKDSMNIETRKQQIEEVARIFGVPRPFLMVDDTSWGTGIEQLGIFFVQYGLTPHFVCWEQAIARTLLSEIERRDLFAKFNERALLRGSMKDQSEFFAKLTGSGGSAQIMEVNEARDFLDLPAHESGTGLSPGMGATSNVQV